MIRKFVNSIHVPRRRLLVVLMLITVLVVLPALFLRHSNAELDKAADLIRAGKAAAAIPILEQMSRKHPDDSSVYPWLAQGYLSTDRVAEGRTALDTALKLKQSPNDLLPVVLAYGYHYQARNDFEEARKLFDSASAEFAGPTLAKAQAELYLMWGDHEFRLGNADKSLLLLETSLKCCAGISEAEKMQLGHKIADLYRQMAATAELKEKNDQRALKFLVFSLRASDEPVTRKVMAEIYLRQGNEDAAIECYVAICKVDQNNLEARHKLIELLLHKNRYAEAREALLELTDREKSVENCELLATVNLKMENFAGATHALEDALDLKPNDLTLVGELDNVLKNWVSKLRQAGKTDEAVSVEGREQRISELLADLIAQQNAELAKRANETQWNPGNPPINLTSSHVWLARGSLTPEGQIQIKNITGKPISDLSLTVVFYDHTRRATQGTVVVPVVGASSKPLEVDGLRLLYFSCPNIVAGDHRLAVKLYWQGRFLKEFPIEKSD